ncbi:zinc transporter ZIP6 [Rhinophrynus dorsalis]
MSDPSPASPLVDAVLAAKTQRQHLLLLFQRYGENNQSLTLSGFRKLLKNLVDERLATERRSHHRHGHHQHHNHHHHPHPTASGQSLPCTEARDKRHVTSRNHPANPEDELSEWVKASFTSGEEELECLNASKLLNSHGMDVHTLLGADEFHFICPAIINQIDRRSCLVHAPEEVVTESNVAGESSQNVNSMKIVWLGGFIAITIISVLSLLGVILLPMMNRVFFKFLLSFLVALAVGTLSGDAFLHLLPHSHAKHHHDHDHSHNSSHLEENDHLDATWKGLTALGGLYLMFLVEHVLILVKQYKDKKQKIQKKSEPEEDFEIKKQLSNHSNIDEKCESDSGSHHEVYLQHGDQEEAHAQQPSAPEEEEEEVMIAHSHDETSYQEYVSRGCENKCHSHFHDTLGQSDDMIHHHHDYHHILHHHHHQNHHPHSHSQRYSREELKDAGIATLAWMVIMGDGLHNFGDGLAIGAAFTEGLSSGLSTSVAVFCHELPHELGDFAVLLKSGMTVRQAVLYNGLSAMLAYLGMITGILIGHYAENVSTWIFALTAGLFMYVAFVDMVPEMLHNDASDHGCSRWGYFLLQNAGILLGFSIMLIISVFEHKIVFNLEL